jgi:hypothetical protein
VCVLSIECPEGTWRPPLRAARVLQWWCIALHWASDDNLRWLGTPGQYELPSTLIVGGGRFNESRPKSDVRRETTTPQAHTPTNANTHDAFCAR